MPIFSVCDVKLEEWKSNQNHVERHFFIPADEVGYQSSRYVFGYSPQFVSKETAEKILKLIEESQP